MTVILRALLVVGVLTYPAAKQRPDASQAVEHDRSVRVETTSLSAAWSGLTGGSRERITREAAAETTRRLAVTKVSQDTLLSSDRRPAWRGTVE